MVDLQLEEVRVFGVQVHMKSLECISPLMVASCAGGSGRTRPHAVARVHRPALQAVHLGARADAVHPTQALALRQGPGRQLLGQLLVELMGEPQAED